MKCHSAETRRVGRHLYRILYVPESFPHDGRKYGAKPDPDQRCIFVSTLISEDRQRRARDDAIRMAEEAESELISD